MFGQIIERDAAIMYILVYVYVSTYYADCRLFLQEQIKQNLMKNI